MITDKTKALLYLSDAEAKILDSMPTNQANSMAEIVRKTGLPRMTIYGAINVLIKRGLVVCRMEKRRKYLVDYSNMASISTPQDRGIRNINGKSNLYSIWKKISELPKHTRVLIIQPVKSLRQSLKRLDWRAEVDSLQKNNVEKSLIFEGIIEEGYYPWLYNFYKQKGKKYAEDVIESFIGRATDITFVRDNLIDAKVEMIITPDQAYIINWDKESAIEIHDADVIVLLRDLFNLAKGYGKKIDQNAYLKKMLAMVRDAE